jgi:hypothetical protein
MTQSPCFSDKATFEALVESWAGILISDGYRIDQPWVHGELPTPARCRGSSHHWPERPQGVGLAGESLKGVDPQSLCFDATRVDNDRGRLHMTTASCVPILSWWWKVGMEGGVLPPPPYTLSSHTRCISIELAGIAWKFLTYLAKIFCSFSCRITAAGASSTMTFTAAS